MQLSSTSRKSTVVRSKNSVRFAKAALHTAYLVSDNLGASFAERLFTSPRRFPRPEREQRVLRTARPSRVDVTLRSPRWNNARISVATWRWGVGPAVLLVHGWEGRGSQLGDFVEPLVAAGMSVIAFDAPGHGSSPDHRLYLTDLADAVADVATAVGPLHGIVAHSFGCAGVLLAYHRHGTQAPRNVMVAPNVLVHDSVTRFANFVGLDDSDRAALQQRFAAKTGIDIEDVRLPALVGERDDGLLLFHDRDDTEVSLANSTQLAALWPNAQVRETSGLGHRRILRDEAVLAATIDYVREGIPLPASDLVREIDRQLGSL